MESTNLSQEIDQNELLKLAERTFQVSLFGRGCWPGKLTESERWQILKYPAKLGSLCEEFARLRQAVI